MEGCATEIAFGQEATLYKLGCEESDAGFPIYKYVEQEVGWKRMGKHAAIGIAVDSTGEPWVINTEKTVFRWNSMDENWLQMGEAGKAREISAGPEGHIYVLSTELQSGAFTILRWEGDQLWFPVPGKGAKHLAVGKYGRPHIIDQHGGVFWPDCNNGPIENIYVPPDTNLAKFIPGPIVPQAFQFLLVSSGTNSTAK